MPSPGKRWYHVTFGTYNSWLPGDSRGFRSRDHKIHSSGHHKNPPPPGEHASLYRHSKAISGPAVTLPNAMREGVCNKIVAILLGKHMRVLVASVGGMHVHLLAELPDDRDLAKEHIGIAKKAGSQLVSKIIPGRVWAKGCGLKPICDEEHHHNTYLYILRHEDEGAFVWTFRD